MALKYPSEQWDPGATVPNGNIASNVADTGNPIKVGGKYNSTAPTLDNGDRGDMELDVNGNVKTREQYAPAYEDNTNGVAKIEQRFSYGALQSTATTTIKSGSGFLHTIVIQTVSCPTTAIYDNTVPSGTKIGWFTANAPLGTYQYDTAFNTGLTLDPVAGGGGSVPFFTISYR